MASSSQKTAMELEFEDIVRSESWPGLFHRLSRDNQWTNTASVNEAKRPDNNKYNRYRNVYPYDRTRVRVKRTPEDYINANFVQVNASKRRYILTQGPLNSSVNHFWSMIWEQNSRGIIMLNKIIENNEIKCHWYWPQDMGSPYKMWLEAVNLTVEQIDYQDYDYYCMRLFVVTDVLTDESREVMQFHYTTWPDFGVPCSPDAFLDFLDKVRAQGVLEPEVGPAIVHCSAGIGRSGTFCLVDSSLVLIERGLADILNVQEILLEMRRDRMGLIQTPDQLRFSYESIIEGERRILTGKRRIYDPAQFIFNVGTAHQHAALEEPMPPMPPPRGTSLSAPAPPAPPAQSDDPPPPPPPSRPLPSVPDSECSTSDHVTDTDSEDGDDNTDPPPPLPPTAAVAVRRRKDAALRARVSAIREKVRRSEAGGGWGRPAAAALVIIAAGVLLYHYLAR